MMKKIASLTACYAFLWAVTSGLFLAICRFLGLSWLPATATGVADMSMQLYFLALFQSLRVHLHNSWLFLALFGGLGVACLLWVIAEKLKNCSPWNSKDAMHVLVFEVFIGAGAVLYKTGTIITLSARFSGFVPFIDTAAIIFFIAVPLLLWLQWHQRRLDEWSGNSTSQNTANIVRAS